MLVDASGLIALLDRSDAAHTRCIEALKDIPAHPHASAAGPALLTVWPALTEAMHLLADVPRAPETLLDMVRDDVLGLFDLEDTDVPRIAELMEKYRDLPMDFADATWGILGAFPAILAGCNVDLYTQRGDDRHPARICMLVLRARTTRWPA